MGQCLSGEVEREWTEYKYQPYDWLGDWTKDSDKDKESNNHQQHSLYPRIDIKVCNVVNVNGCNGAPVVLYSTGPSIREDEDNISFSLTMGQCTSAQQQSGHSIEEEPYAKAPPTRRRTGSEPNIPSKFKSKYEPEYRSRYEPIKWDIYVDAYNKPETRDRSRSFSSLRWDVYIEPEQPKEKPKPKNFEYEDGHYLDIHAPDIKRSVYDDVKERRPADKTSGDKLKKGDKHIDDDLFESGVDTDEDRTSVKELGSDPVYSKVNKPREQPVELFEKDINSDKPCDKPVEPVYKPVNRGRLAAGQNEQAKTEKPVEKSSETNLNKNKPEEELTKVTKGVQPNLKTYEEPVNTEPVNKENSDDTLLKRPFKERVQDNYPEKNVSEKQFAPNSIDETPRKSVVAHNNKDYNDKETEERLKKRDAPPTYNDVVPKSPTKDKRELPDPHIRNMPTSTANRPNRQEKTDLSENQPESNDKFTKPRYVEHGPKQSRSDRKPSDSISPILVNYDDEPKRPLSGIREPHEQKSPDSKNKIDKGTKSPVILNYDQEPKRASIKKGSPENKSPKLAIKEIADGDKDLDKAVNGVGKKPMANGLAPLIKSYSSLPKKSGESIVTTAIITPRRNSCDDLGTRPEKNAIKDTVLIPTKFPQLFTGKRHAWRGLLLFGPSGSGKASLATAVAKEIGHSYCTLRTFKSLNSYKDNAVAAMFKRARASAPHVIIIDHLDGLTASELRELRTQMESTTSEQFEGILVVGISDSPWLLDKSVVELFEKRIFITLPSAASRAELFRENLKQSQHALSEEDFIELGAWSEGYSCADIITVVNETLMHSLRKIKDAGYFKKVLVRDPETDRYKDLYTPCSPGETGAIEMDWTRVPEKKLQEPLIRLCDVLVALRIQKPSLHPDDIHKHKEFAKRFTQH